MNDVAKKYNAYAYAPSGKLTVVAAIDHLGSVVEQGLTPRDGHGRPYATTDNISGCIFVEFGRGYRKCAPDADKWRAGGGRSGKLFVVHLQQTLQRGIGIITQSTGARYQFRYYKLISDDATDHTPKPVLYLVGQKLTHSTASRETPPTPKRNPTPPRSYFAVDEEIMGLPLPSTTKKQRTEFDQDDY